MEDPAPMRGAELGQAFEELLAAVWEAEKDWRLMDRIDLSLAREHPPHQSDAF